jgi:Isy1-like splicing family
MRAMERRDITRDQSESVENPRLSVSSLSPSKSHELNSPHTAGLTDYEVRDLNDEINKLMREKRHWENQIIALGGANYRRNVAMLDDDGREVPGTKGYKCEFLPLTCSFSLPSDPVSQRYFGRAKELPGVKELFESRKKEEDEENATHNFYKKFTNQGPAYFGDLDEADGELLKYEEEAEEEGAHLFPLSVWQVSTQVPSSQSHCQDGKRPANTYVKYSVFPPTRLSLEYRGAQAHTHLMPRPRITPCQRHQIASAKPQTTITLLCQNPTANSLSAQNQMHLFRPLQAQRRQIQLLPLCWPMPVRRRPTFRSYPWKVSCHPRCPQERKWRVCSSICASVPCSRIILEISFFWPLQYAFPVRVATCATRRLSLLAEHSCSLVLFEILVFNLVI